MNALNKSWTATLKLAAIALFCVAFSAVQANAQSLLRDTEIEETLREFTDPILRAGGLTPSSVDIYLVNDPSLNAFVTRGQNIFLHSGLILAADNPNQLKGVIAHEAGHITGGHIVRSDYGNRSAYGAMLIAAGIGLAAILAGEGQAGALVLGGSQQFGVLEALSYSRVNESAADQYAFDYMDRTGQSAQGLIDFFEKFRAHFVLLQK
jgi:predicted Zn-dependent protease